MCGYCEKTTLASPCPICTPGTSTARVAPAKAAPKPRVRRASRRNPSAGSLGISAVPGAILKRTAPATLPPDPAPIQAPKAAPVQASAPPAAATLDDLLAAPLAKPAPRKPQSASRDAMLKLAAGKWAEGQKNVAIAYLVSVAGGDEQRRRIDGLVALDLDAQKNGGLSGNQEKWRAELLCRVLREIGLSPATWVRDAQRGRLESHPASPGGAPPAKSADDLVESIFAQAALLGQGG